MAPERRTDRKMGGWTDMGKTISLRLCRGGGGGVKNVPIYYGVDKESFSDAGWPSGDVFHHN